MAKSVAVQMKGISKYFGDVAANKNVNLTVYEGEILSVLGENGSGKTTLMNMLSGIYFPDEGEILIGENPVVIRSPRDAYRYKIGMVHQHFKLVDIFTALDNVILGEEMPRFSVREQAEELKEEAEAPRYLVDNDDAEAPVKTVRDTDTALGRFRLALRTSALSRPNRLPLPTAPSTAVKFLPHGTTAEPYACRICLSRLPTTTSSSAAPPRLCRSLAWA